MRVLRTGLPVAILGRHPCGSGHPQPRVLVRDDRRPALAEDLVRPGVLRMPVGVEQRRDATAGDNCRRIPINAIAELRRAAVDQHQAVGGREREDVGAAARDQRQSIVQRDEAACRAVSPGPHRGEAGPGCRAGRRRRQSGVVCGRTSQQPHQTPRIVPVPSPNESHAAPTVSKSPAWWSGSLDVRR